MPEERNDAQRDHALNYWCEPVFAPDMSEPGGTDLTAQDFSRFAEFLPTLCWIARGDGYIVWYNRRWHDYCGTTPEQMEGWGWQTVHDPHELPIVMERWQQSIAAGAPFEMVFPLRGADGVFRPFLTRIVPLRNEAGTDRSLVRRKHGDWRATTCRDGALEASEAKYRVLTDAMPQMVWSTLPDGYHDYYNAQWYAFTGVPVGSTDGEGWNGMFHPDDQEAAWERWRHSLATGQRYEIEYRLRHNSGEYRWVLGRALPVRNPEGAIIRWIGTCTDIDEAKRAAERNELLSRELSHRIKNIFAVISGLVSLTGSRASELRPIVKELLGRIAALARAHEFARPHSPRSNPALGEGTLKGLLAEILRPYDLDGTNRISICGADAVVDDKGATPIALVVHELATNAAKYGALSTRDGHVTVEVAAKGDQLELCWVEQNGPAIVGPPEHRGFGTDLAELSVRRQLGGEISKDWRPEGLKVVIRVSASRLHRNG